MLAERYAVHAKTTRTALDTATKLGDAATPALFTENSRAIDKALWLLVGHTQE